MIFFFCAEAAVGIASVALTAIAAAPLFGCAAGAGGDNKRIVLYQGVGNQLRPLDVDVGGQLGKLLLQLLELCDKLIVVVLSLAC